MSTGILAIEPEPSQEENHGLALQPFASAPVDFYGHPGAGTLSLTAAQADTLMKPLPDDDHDILVTGEVYVSHIFVRRILNRVFSPGGWALVPRGPFTLTGDRVSREYALVIGGRFVSEAIGGTDYQPSNERMSYDDACEGAKSNALTRAVKDLGIASECWDKRFVESFKAKYCVQVWMGKGEKPRWRRRDSPPIWGETGLVQPKQQGSRPTPANTAPEPELDFEDAELMGEPAPAPRPAPQAAPRSQPRPVAKGRGNVPCTMCGGEAMPSQYAKPGATFYCKSCGHKFDPPVAK